MPMFEYACLRATSRCALALLGLVMATFFLPSAAMAEGCDDLAASIAKMDASSVKPPGYYSMRNSLIVSGIFCTNRQQPSGEMWYRIDGSPTYWSTNQGRPSDGAFSMTPAIAEGCMRDAPDNLSVCAMFRGARKACATTQDPQQRALCVDLFGESIPEEPALDTGWSGVPDMVVSLGGRNFKLPFACQDVMNRMGDYPDLVPSSYSASTLKAGCPDFLAALEQRIGAGLYLDAAAFWAGFRDLIISNFAPRGAPPVSVASIAADPNFRRMCDQAAKFENQCRINQGKMGEVGTTSTSTALQAGDFNDCANVYGGVRKMCSRTTAAASAQPRVVSAAPKPAVNSAALPPRPSGGSSMAPPVKAATTQPPPAAKPAEAPVVDPRTAQVAALMIGTSAQCQADLRNYLYGSRDGNGSNGSQTATMRSFAGINADPECKAVLDRLASSAGVQMPQRVLTSTSRSTWGSAMADAPRAAINVPSGATADAPPAATNVPNGQYADVTPSSGGWNTGEVISAGTQILSVLGDILGATAAIAGGYSGGSSYTSQPVTRAPSAPSGYVYRRSGSASTITGTGQ